MEYGFIRKASSELAKFILAGSELKNSGVDASLALSDRQTDEVWIPTPQTLMSLPI